MNFALSLCVILLLLLVLIELRAIRALLERGAATDAVAAESLSRIAQSVSSGLL